MTRAILVNEEHNYVAYGHPHNDQEAGFETAPHATIEVFIKAKGNESKGGTLYLLRYPCYECAKAIVYAGIKKVIYKNENPGDPTRPEAQLLLEHSDVEVIKNEELDF